MILWQKDVQMQKNPKYKNIFIYCSGLEYLSEYAIMRLGKMRLYPSDAQSENENPRGGTLWGFHFFSSIEK